MLAVLDMETKGREESALLPQTEMIPEQEACPHCRHKETPRSAQLQRSLQSRLNRVIGQLNGVKGMLDDNRYCGDILIQVAAAERALQSFGYALLEDHLETCVREEVRAGSSGVMRETVELVKKLK